MKIIFFLHLIDKPEHKTGRRIRYFLVSWAFISIFTAPVFTQEIFERIAPDKYLIEFTDKLNSPYTLESPEEYLSPKALERRRKQGISVSQNDLPVNRVYIDSLKNAGASVLTMSRWLNEAAVQVSDSIMLDRIARFSFVKKNISKVPVHHADSFPENRLALQEIVAPASLEYGASWLQVAVHNGQYLHNHGYTGENITIAVIDAGFSRADVLPAFENLWGNNRMLGSRNMINPGSSVFGYSGHGMSVLSIIGGYVRGELIGSAPDASFWLIKSEDAASEYIIEEDYWIAAAEFADSVGVDIINTSLGYSEFNDKTQNHTYSDMDGNTTRISRAADIAASKGMLVVVSAGNQGHKPWKYITAPADADSVLTIGAVDPSLNVADFSGRGPSSDNQVKPDIMAIGQGIYVSKLDGSVDQGSGTSFSAPLITGLAACLWQANPDATAMEIRAAINKSADRFGQPDNNYGYGIPDFNLANALLKLDEDNGEVSRPVYAFPNPFNTQLYIFFKSGIHTPVDITLYDLSGNEVMRSTYPPFSGRTYLKIEGAFDELPKGAYIIRICTGDITENSKLIKF